jgi:hypothetical protein
MLQRKPTRIELRAEDKEEVLAFWDLTPRSIALQMHIA